MTQKSIGSSQNSPTKQNPKDETSSNQRLLLTMRDFLGEETWKAWKQDEESLLQQRNQVASKGGKPTEEDLMKIRMNKPWLEFYKSVLYDPTKAKSKQ